MSDNLDSSTAAPAVLRIAVIGMGQIGSAFAFQLARSGGHQVTAIARPGSPRLAQLMRDGGVVTVEQQLAALEVADALDPTIPYDLILVTLLAHQAEAILPALTASAARSIQFMFNTFDPERLRDQLGADRCGFGMPFIQATLNADGKLKASIGAGGQKCKLDRQHWVDVFAAAGLPAVLEPQMLLWLRCHAPMCVAFESISVAGLRRGGGASWREAITIARGAQECFSLIEQLGYKLYPGEKKLFHAAPSWVLGGLLWSLSRVRSFRELLATGVGECRALIDIILTAAAPLTAASPASISAARIAAMKP